MKLLIEIPEHIYEHAKEMTEDSQDEGEAMRAIANGSRQESRSEIPNTCGDEELDFVPEHKKIPCTMIIGNPCGDAISRKHLLEEIALLKKSPWFNENTYGSKVIRKEAVEIVEDVCIKREPSVNPQPIECGDAISRQAVLDGIAEWIVDGYADSEADCSHISSLVTHLPSVTPQPKMGRWIYDKIDMNGYYLNSYECSVCKCTRNSDTSYCPNCGAKMEVEE